MAFMDAAKRLSRKLGVQKHAAPLLRSPGLKNI